MAYRNVGKLFREIELYNIHRGVESLSVLVQVGLYLFVIGENAIIYVLQ